MKKKYILVNKEPARALKYLTKLSLSIQLNHVKKFGRELLEAEEEAVMELLKSIISNDNVVISSISDGSDSMLDTKFQINIEDIFEVVDSKSELLIDLCYFCCRLDKCAHVTTIWRRLLEIELKLWREKEKRDSDILSVLKMERMEPKTALVLCRQFDFKPGLIHLLQGQPDRSADLLAVFIEGGLHDEAIEICTEQPQLWQKA